MSSATPPRPSDPSADLWVRRGARGRSTALDGIAVGPRPPMPREVAGDPWCLGTSSPAAPTTGGPTAAGTYPHR
jgi:hypothetical protein